MKKNLLLLLAGVVALFAISSCQKDPEPEPEPGCPVTDVTIVSPASIGDYLEIKAKGFSTNAVITLKPQTGADVVLSDPEISASGLKVLLDGPLSPGAHNVILLQDGTWELGSVLLQEAQNPVTDCVVPFAIKIGKPLEIKGSGFPDNSVIILTNGNSISELTAEKTADGVKVQVPSTLPPGNWDIILKVNLNQFSLAKGVPAAVYKRIKKMVFLMGTDIVYDEDVLEVAAGQQNITVGELKEWIEEQFEGMIGYDILAIYDFVYDNQGRIDRIDFVLGDVEEYAKFTYADSGISYTLNESYGLFTDYFGGEWTLNSAGFIENSISDYGNKNVDLTFKYDENNHLVSTHKGTSESAYSSMAYDENGNLVFLKAAAAYENIAKYDLTKKLNIFSPDLIKLIYVTDENSIDPDVALANILGLSGVCSTNVPNEHEMYGEYVPVEVSLDSDNYCTHLSTHTMSMGSWFNFGEEVYQGLAYEIEYE